jgi:glycerophosphoryl diester phosphodiesterase
MILNCKLISSYFEPPSKWSEKLLKVTLLLSDLKIIYNADISECNPYNHCEFSSFLTLVGHRGCIGSVDISQNEVAIYMPIENTMTGIIAGILQGLRFFEFDLVFTKDNQLVLSHDEELIALYKSKEGLGSEDRRNNVSEFTCEELKEIARSIGHDFTTFEDVLDFYNFYNQRYPDEFLFYNVELKGAFTADVALSLIQSTIPENDHKQFTFSSFRYSNISKLLENSGELGGINVSILMDNDTAVIEEDDDSFISLKRIEELVVGNPNFISSVGLWKDKVETLTIEKLVDLGISQFNIYSCNKLEKAMTTTSYPEVVQSLSESFSEFDGVEKVWIFVDTPSISSR